MNELIDKSADDFNWSEKLLFQVRLIMEELLINFFNYGGSDHKLIAEIEFTSGDDSIDIVISDTGIAFNPLVDTQEPDLTSSIEDRAVGGLGVFFVKTLVDDISYLRQDDRNILRISVKKI